MSSGHVTWEKGRPGSFSFPRLNLWFRLLRFICNAISDLLSWVFVYIYPYRKKIILKNLTLAFPLLSAKERNRILLGYYRHLGDLVTETFLVSFCNREDLHRLVRYENIAVLRDILDRGKDVVLMASHCGNWEYLLSLPMEIHAEVLTAYSSISNTWLNTRLKKMRGKYGMGLILKQDWYKASLKYGSGQPAVFIAVADQRPAGKSKETVNFFGQKTYIQCGAARLSQKRDAVMVYVDVRKQDRNAYIFRFVELNGQLDHMDGIKLMEQYYFQIEKTIRRQPELWLWSHNRWKFD